MTILEALTWGENELKQTALEKKHRGHNAKLDAQILLSTVLKKPSSYLFAHFTQPLNNEAVEAYQRLIERRKRHEPVAYLVGKKDFYKRSFVVNPFVLIPRPETEAMVELALSRLTPETTIIDVGTGSGAIAVTLAAESGQPVVAIDIDPNAIRVAQINAKQHAVSHLISFLKGDLLLPYIEKNITQTTGNTLVLANLPYLPTGHRASLDPDVKDYEPEHALFAGVDGLGLYDRLLQQLREERSRFGASIELLAEMDPSQQHSLPDLIRHVFPDAKISIQPDLSGKPRLVHALIK